jgi:hypothetical protein
MKLLVTAALGAALLVQGPAWRSSAPGDVQVTSDRPGCLTVRNTGRASVDLWRERARPVSGEYTVKATLKKTGGRRMEGYGLLFGGRALGTDTARYSYVLIRGDGSVLVKKRDGAATPTVRDWMRAAAVRADDARGAAENVLEVRVSPREVIVLVNDTEVVRVPAAELFTDGFTGVRIAHTLTIEVIGFDESGRC